MPKRTPSPPTSAGSPSPAVVSAALAALRAELADERAARRATEAALCEAEQARSAAEAARQTAEARAARLEAENAYSAEQISRLEHLNKELRKALFGPRSEIKRGVHRSISEFNRVPPTEMPSRPLCASRDGETVLR